MNRGHNISFERISRAIVVTGALVAVFGMASLGAREWPALLPLTLAAVVGAVAGGRWLGSAAGWLILPFTYCSAALILGWLGYSRSAFQAPLVGAVLGMSLSTGIARGWALPVRWRVPLAWWALAAVFGAAVVVLRELDFEPRLMSGGVRIANSGVGGPPWVVTAWVSYVLAGLTVGILWFDSFFASYPGLDARAFRRHVMMPLAVSVAAASALASYQGLVDIYWLSGHAWGAQGRAAGGLVDGDAFGALAGFWTGIFLALAATGSWRASILGISGAALCWVGLWSSGSRMALLAGVVSSFAGPVLFAAPYCRRHPWRTATAAVVLVAAIVGASLVGLEWQTQNPLRRTIESIPSPDVASVVDFAEHQLWNRDAPFGTAFLWMMGDYPLVGVGLGSFHMLYADYAYLITGYHGVPENAQSWYRHQLAELGVLGSIGWIWWVGLVVGLVMRRAPATRPAIGWLKTTLLAIAVVSAVSMPTQHIAVALTVWPVLFWLLCLSPEAQTALDSNRAPSRKAWLWMFAGVLVFAVATLAVGWYSLRPPQRALRANWAYTRGFFGFEGGERPFRWTKKYAVDVPHVTARWMRMTIGGGPPDVATRPLGFTVKRNGEQILDYELTDRRRHTWWVRVPAGPPRVMIEIEVDRTWSPADYGSSDTRELGVAVQPWTFAEVPPRDAATIR